MRADDLLLLLEIARRGSLASAASALAVNHATVSRRITSLERELGETLIARTAQGCELTTVGAALIESCEAVERAVARSKALVARRDSPNALFGTVHIASTDGFGAAILAPMLAEVSRDNPDLRVELSTSVRMSVYAAGSDIEIGVGEPLASRRGAASFAKYELAWYAAQTYLDQHSYPEHRHDLVEHDLVYYVESTRLLEELHLVGPALSENVRFGSTNVHAQLKATLAGAGIGLLPAFLARDHPELRRVLPDVAIQREFLYSVASMRTRRPSTEAVMTALLKGIKHYASVLHA